MFCPLYCSHAEIAGYKESWCAKTRIPSMDATGKLLKGRKIHKATAKEPTQELRMLTHAHFVCAHVPQIKPQAQVG
jgi:hypothetical protein